jgi:uncharacterized protein YlxW (UPF0749 family)
MATTSGNQAVPGVEKRSKGSRVPFIVTLVLLILGVAGFAWYYFNATGRISDLQNQLSATNSTKDSLQTQVSTLQSQVSSASSQVSSLQNQVNSANAQIASLQSQLGSGSSQVTSLQSQLNSANAQIASLQNLLNLNSSSVKASQVTINQSANQTSQVITFNATYAGYIVVSGTSTTSNGYITVTDSFSSYPTFNSGHDNNFGTGAVLTIPVLPGTVTVYFGNANAFTSATATITVTYYS